MTNHTLRTALGWLLAALLGLLGLSGCHTAPVALEQANHIVALLAELEEQLAEYRQIASAAERARLESLENQKTKIRETRVRATLDSSSSIAAGDKTREPFAQKLVARADNRAKAAAQSASEAEAYAAKLAALLTPQPDLKPSITQAQVDIAPLGQELDLKVRFNEFKDYFTELATGLKDAKKKIDDAEAAAAAADKAAKAAADSSSSQVKTAVEDAVGAKSK